MLESPLSLCSTFLKLIQDSYWTYQDILVVQLSVYWINFLKFYQESVMGKGQFMEWRFLLSWFKCSSSQQLLSLSCEQLLVSHDLPSRKKDEEIHLFQIIFSSWLDFLFTSSIISGTQTHLVWLYPNHSEKCVHSRIPTEAPGIKNSW